MGHQGIERRTIVLAYEYINDALYWLHTPILNRNSLESQILNPGRVHGQAKCAAGRQVWGAGGIPEAVIGSDGQ
jgi:hypothetical protein